MLPDYATILIALASAGLAGYGGASLQVRHERKESLWNRRIAAADDLATKLAQAAMRAEAAIRQPSGTEMDEFQRLVDEALAASARVDLLFGKPGTPTVAASNQTLHALGQIAAHLRIVPPNTAEAQGFLNEVGKSLSEFIEAAGGVIRDGRE